MLNRTRNFVLFSQILVALVGCSQGGSVEYRSSPKSNSADAGGEHGEHADPSAPDKTTNSECSPTETEKAPTDKAPADPAKDDHSMHLGSKDFEAMPKPSLNLPAPDCTSDASTGESAEEP